MRKNIFFSYKQKRTSYTMEFKGKQKEVDDWISEHGGYWPPLSMLARLMEECGELSREINLCTG